MTGSTPYGGGLWKYILRDFMKRDVPLFSQVLHFLDFPVNGKEFGKVAKVKPFVSGTAKSTDHTKHRSCLIPEGFKLLYNTGLDLSEFGINAETEADDIIALQNDMGGDIIASLDYPLLTGLDRAEAERRMNRSLNNAYRVTEHIADRPEPAVLVHLLSWTIPG